MLAAGYAPNVARQGRAKLCSCLLLELEDYEKELSALENDAHALYRGILLWSLVDGTPCTELLRGWPHLRAYKAWLDRRDKSRRKYALRNPKLLFIPTLPDPGCS